MERRLKSALIRFGRMSDGASPLSALTRPAERSCAAGEAAPMAFSYRLLAVFSEIPEKPRVRSEPIPFLYPLAVSAER